MQPCRGAPGAAGERRTAAHPAGQQYQIAKLNLLLFAADIQQLPGTYMFDNRSAIDRRRIPARGGRLLSTQQLESRSLSKVRKARALQTCPAENA